MTQRGYQSGVATIRDVIAAGGVYQANLCRVLEADLPPNSDLVGLAVGLGRGNPAPHAGVIHLPDHDVSVASASPELFLRRAGDVITSSPIKGTGRTQGDLLPKDDAENVMIVDLVRNDLGRVCIPGSVDVPALLSIEHHPGLVHLVSTVEGTLAPTVGWSQILDATFPPGSVTGAPKHAARSLIAALEPVPRGAYCGAVGWIDADARRGELAVGIRTFSAEPATLSDAARVLRFGTGAGITWGSDPSAEWQETELKAERLLRVASERSAA
jgi:para-aminobenzoate synthetase component 1